MRQINRDFLERIASIIGNAFVILFAIWFFIYPALISLIYIQQLSQYSNRVAPFVYEHHFKLTEEYNIWFANREKNNNEFSLSDIPKTEWPLYSTVFYLWATENLQREWEKDPTAFPQEPKKYSALAVERAAKFVIDPKNAEWVKNKWGSTYLTEKNLFYRMLLINGLLSYQNLTGNHQYEEMLRFQVEDMAKELDESEFGVVDDYPGECYPIDIIPVIAAIKLADKILGTDHSDFVTRAKRGFIKYNLDAKTGLPSYLTDSTTGEGIGSSRGVAMSFMLNWTPEIWEDVTTDWLEKYYSKFVQTNSFVAGIREYPRDSDIDANQVFGILGMDVDAGPIVLELGTTASAFGIGAFRTNGDIGNSYALSAEAIAASWPLPDRTLLFPRVISTLGDAPFTGESVILFGLSRTSYNGHIRNMKYETPLIVALLIVVQLAIGGNMIFGAIRRMKIKR